MTETPNTDFELETIRDGFTALGRIHGRYAAAKTLADKALEDAAHGELKWAGVCNCEPEMTQEERAARAEAEQVIANVTKAFAERPTVVVLCGSTRFSHAFREANLTETLAGRIVLSIGCDMRSDAALFAHLSEAEVGHIKAGLDELHLRKIDLADEVLILNVGGYVGESTRREIDYAISHGKTLRWLEPGTPDTPEGLAERMRQAADAVRCADCGLGADVSHAACISQAAAELPASADDEGDEEHPDDELGRASAALLVEPCAKSGEWIDPEETWARYGG